MYKERIRLFAKNEEVLKTIVRAEKIYSQNMAMELGIE